MISTAEAAKILGVSPRRVTALIESGDLAAQRIGRSWAVDEQSVAERAAAPKWRGRPPAGASDPRSVETCTLMSANREVARFAYDRSSKQVVSIRELDDARYAPPAACSTRGKVDRFNLNNWLLHRLVPRTRSGIADMLREAGCSDPHDLMFGSLGLNLSDQYWFKPEGLQLDWHHINYFENPYIDRGKNVRRSGGGTLTLFGPGTSTDGQLPKHWELRADGTSYLVKGSSWRNYEPYAEALSTMLYGRLLDRGDYVPYTLEGDGESAVSVCPCFVSRSTELVTLSAVETRYGTGYPKSRYENYASILERLGIRGVRTKLSKMLVCDFLTANTDRHENNLGALRDVETLEWVDVAPIFDNGRGFFFAAAHREELTEELYYYQSNPFEERPIRQLALAEDLGWFDAGALEGFGGDIAELLSRNKDLPDWFPEAAAAQFERRIRRVRDIQREM